MEKEEIVVDSEIFQNLGSCDLRLAEKPKQYSGGSVQRGRRLGWGTRDFPGGAVAKNLPADAANTGATGLIPGSGRSPGEGNGNPLQFSCLENSWMEEPGGLQSMGSQRVRHD